MADIHLITDISEHPPEHPSGSMLRYRSEVFNYLYEIRILLVRNTNLLFLVSGSKFPTCDTDCWEIIDRHHKQFMALTPHLHEAPEVLSLKQQYREWYAASLLPKARKNSHIFTPFLCPRCWKEYGGKRLVCSRCGAYRVR